MYNDAQENCPKHLIHHCKICADISDQFEKTLILLAGVLRQIWHAIPLSIQVDKISAFSKYATFWLYVKLLKLTRKNNFVCNNNMIN